MKKSTKVLATVWILVCLLLMACQAQQASTNETTAAAAAAVTPAATSGKKPVVGIVVKVLTGNSFQIDLAKYLEQSAEKYGFEYSTHAPQTFGDFAQQTSIVEDLITKKVDLIVIAPAHETAVTPALEKAMQAGIGVITVDTMIDNPDANLTYIGPDNVQAAYEITKYVCEKMGGKGKFVHIEGEVGHAVAEWRKEGCLKALAEYPEVELVVSQNGNWSNEGGMKVMENALQAHPDIAGVFSANDDAALGAIEACKAKNVRPVIAGFDAIEPACQAIKNGELDATVAFYPEAMADAAFRAGAAYMHYLNDGKLSYFSDWIDSGATVITPENVDTMLK